MSVDNEEVEDSVTGSIKTGIFAELVADNPGRIQDERQRIVQERASKIGWKELVGKKWRKYEEESRRQEERTVKPTSSTDEA
jgi:hypothetical protein